MRNYLKYGFLILTIAFIFCQIPVAVQWRAAKREIVHSKNGDVLVVEMHSNKAIWNLGVLCEPAFFYIRVILRYKYGAEAPAENESIFLFYKEL